MSKDLPILPLPELKQSPEPILPNSNNANQRRNIENSEFDPRAAFPPPDKLYATYSLNFDEPSLPNNISEIMPSSSPQAPNAEALDSQEKENSR